MNRFNDFSGLGEDFNTFKEEDVNLKETGTCDSSGVKATYEWYNSIIVAVSIVVIMLTFFFRLVNVDGTSMQQTLQDKDRVLVSNLFFTPKSGDVIIISHGEVYDKPLVKRVIATEGQSLKIDFQEQVVMVDGIVIDEPYKYTAMSEGGANIPTVIPKGKIFVMGDHREVSMDSRHKDIGLIDAENVLGKVYYVMFPFDHFKKVY